MFCDAILLLVQVVVIRWDGILGMAQYEEGTWKVNLVDGGDVDGSSCWIVSFDGNNLVPIQTIDTTIVGGGKTRQG